MEVKDINSLAAMLVSNRTQKADSQLGAQTALQNFKDLFSQGNLFEFQSAEKTSMTQKTTLLDSRTKADVSQNKAEKVSVKSETKAEKKDSAPIKENKSNKTEEKSSQNVSDKKDSSVTQNKDTSSVQDSDQTTSKQETAENTTSSEAQTTENSEQAQDAPVAADETTQTVTEEEPNLAQDTDGDITADNLLSEELNIILPEVLQNMGAVTVYNSMDNTYAVMDGEEISDLLAASDIDINAYMSENGRSDVTIMPTAEASAPEKTTPQIALDGFENIEPETMEIMPQAENAVDAVKKQHQTQQASDQTQPAAAVEEFVDEAASKQSEKLAEMIGSDKKINMNVNVEEENFSYQTAKVTVKEVLAAADVSQTKVEDKVPANADVDVQAPTQGNNISGNASGNIVSAQAMPMQDMNTAGKINVQNAQTTAVKGLSEASSNNMTHLAGADSAAQGLKAESGVNAENKSSFRDIYKGMSREVAEQVKVNITKSAVKGVDSIEIKLKPEELGHIEIKMQLSKDGKLQAHIIASRAETGEMLQKELPSLEKAFTDAGFSLDEGSLSFSYREENSAKEQNNELRNFIGRVLEQDAENENNQEYGSQISESWDGTSALNIRV